MTIARWEGPENVLLKVLQELQGLTASPWDLLTLREVSKPWQHMVDTSVQRLAARDVTPSELAAILRTYTGLQSLKLAVLLMPNPQPAAAATIAAVFDASAPHLWRLMELSLALRPPLAAPQPLHSLGGLTGLASLSLRSFPLAPGAAAPLRHLTALTHLGLVNCEAPLLLTATAHASDPQHVLPVHPLYEVLPHLTALSSLDLSRTTSLTAMALGVLAYTPTVTALSLSGCCSLGDDSLAVVAAHLPSLRSLDASWLPDITRQGILALAPLTVLSQLCLRQSPLPTQGALAAVVAFGGNLEEVDVTDTWVRHELCRLAPLPRLRVLKAASAHDYGLSDSELEVLLISSPLLEWLEAPSLQHRPTRTAAALARLTRLTHLALVEGALTAPEHCAVFSRLTRLTHLSIDRMDHRQTGLLVFNRVPEPAQLGFLAALKQLRELRLSDGNLRGQLVAEDCTLTRLLALTSLHLLRNCQLGEVDVMAVGRLSRLQDLALEGTAVGPFGLRGIAALTNLRSLAVPVSLYKDGGSQLSSLASLSALSGLTGLHSLQLNNPSSSNATAQNIPILERSAFGQQLREALAAALTNLRQLEAVSLVLTRNAKVEIDTAAVAEAAAVATPGRRLVRLGLPLPRLQKRVQVLAL